MFQNEFTVKGSKILPITRRFRSGSVPSMHRRTSIAAPPRGRLTSIWPTAVGNINIRQRACVSVSMQPIRTPAKLSNNIRRASITSPGLLEKNLRSSISATADRRYFSMIGLNNHPSTHNKCSQNFNIFRVNASSRLPEIISFQNSPIASRGELSHHRRDHIRLPSSYYSSSTTAPRDFNLLKTTPVGLVKAFATLKAPSRNIFSDHPPLLDIRLRALQSRKSDNNIDSSAIFSHKSSELEKKTENISPLSEDSLSKLRARAQLAKEHLSRHKILLDRYLPISLGPAKDVMQEVEARYGELALRMPHLDHKTMQKEDIDYAPKIPPYTPASVCSTGKKPPYEIQHISVTKSFTPKISDTRKKARSVLCKIKGDPRYFDF